MNHMRWIVGIPFVAAGALALGGCYYDFSDGRDRDTASTGARAPDTVSEPTPSGGSITRWTGQAELFRGDLGSVRGFEGANAEITASDYGTSSSSVRIDAENTAARWWAMTQFSVSGSLHHPRLVPGARLVFNAQTRASYGGSAGATALYVSVLGCSGPRRNQYTYDHSADEVTISVSEGPAPETRRIDFDAKFTGTGGEQHVTGSFVYETR